MHQSSCWRASSDAVRYRSTSSISSVICWSKSSSSPVRWRGDRAAMPTQLRERDRFPEGDALLVLRVAVLRGEVRADVLDERLSAAAVRFEVDRGADFLAVDLLAVLLLVVDFLAGAFLAVDLVAGDVLAVDFFAGAFLAGALVAGDLLAGAVLAVGPPAGAV